MPKYIKIGKTELETKSLLIGLLVAYAGLSIPQTKSLFTKVYSAIANFVTGIFGKK